MSRSATKTRRVKILIEAMALVREASTIAKTQKVEALAKLAEARRLFESVADHDTAEARARTISLFDQCEAAISNHH